MSLDMSVEVLPKYVQIELLGVYTFTDLMEQGRDQFRSEADKAGTKSNFDRRPCDGRQNDGIGKVFRWNQHR